jgi:hypothetical protein
MIRIRRGDGHPTWGAVWIDIGRLRLFRCAAKHPNRWMVAWRRRQPEWDPKTKWEGANEPGRFFKGCIRRQLREPGPLTGCKFPNCDCGRGEEWERRCKEFERREAEGKAYREAWLARLKVLEALNREEEPKP